MERWWWVSLCIFLYVHVMVSECVRVWVSDVSVVCVSKGFESEWSEWSEWSEVEWKKPRPKGRRLTSDPLAVQAEPQGTPGRTSDRLAQIVPRLPRKRSGAPRDVRAYIRPPWQCTLSHACHGAPREARAYIWPLESAHCPTPAT